MTTLFPFYDLIFDKSFYSFNRCLKDMYPYKIKTEDDKVTIIHNVLGIDEEDIKIEIKKEQGNYYLYILGETQDKETEEVYNVRSKFSIDAELTENITWTVKNGILKIIVNRKKENPIDIKIIKQ